MSESWIHVERLGLAGELVQLSPDETRHVAARRLRVGDPVVAFDGAGGQASSRIESVDRRTVALRLGPVEIEPATDPVWLLATAIPKGERLSDMLSMLTQLGVPAWQPLVLADSAVRELDVAAPRLRRILVESAKVARRARLLEVHPPVGLDALLAKSAGVGPIRFGDRIGEEVGIGGDVSLVVIGPEAGLRGEEIDRLRAAGARSARLATRNLRIETAAVAAAATRFACANRVG